MTRAESFLERSSVNNELALVVGENPDWVADHESFGREPSLDQRLIKLEGGIIGGGFGPRHAASVFGVAATGHAEFVAIVDAGGADPSHEGDSSEVGFLEIFFALVKEPGGVVGCQGS